MTATSSPQRQLDHLARPVIVVSRVGAIFVGILGIVHAVVNTIGFAELGFQPWLEYLIFGVGLSVIAFALAAVAWTLSRHHRPPWAGVVFLGLGSALLLLQLVGAFTDPALLVRPLGPGPWSMIAGPALAIETVALAARRIHAGRHPSH